MIKYNPKNWFSYIFKYYKSDTISILFWELIAIAVYSIIVSLVFGYASNKTMWSFQKVGVQGILSFIISMLLVFRINSAYDRWWEGRKAWGVLVNKSRNLSLKIVVYFSEENDTKLFFSRMIGNYAQACKQHLRSYSDLDKLDLNFDEKKYLSTKKHIPNAIAKLMFKKIKLAHNLGKISSEDMIVITKDLDVFTDVIGICERIKKTPIPFSYNIYLKKVILIFCISLPFGLVSVFGYFTCLLTTFTFYVFVSLEIISEEIEDPFGTDDNDLPLDDLAVTISNNSKEILLED